MGLDTFAAHTPDDIELTEEDIQAFRNAEITLCWGIFTSDGSEGSFRGKVYEPVVRRITGVSLYQEWIPPEIVREMYHAFRAYEHSKWKNEDIKPEDIEHSDLCKFFKVCSERNLGLVGWS